MGLGVEEHSRPVGDDQPAVELHAHLDPLPARLRPPGWRGMSSTRPPMRTVASLATTRS